ncbi:MAG: arylsulfatase [Verrucomicrobiales bacterium]|nr:arylsulfatase [Verrucomicrobiales bacterium]
MRILAALLLLVACASAAPRQPNIIVILVDDMGFSDIGCYGGEIPTPHLDALARDGVAFTQFYNTGRCCPTRASLLTGLYSHQTGIGWMTADQGAPGYRGHLNDQCVTMAEVLGAAGYFTAMTGKWHVGFEHGVTPWNRGFQRSLNMPAGGLHFSDQGGAKAKAGVYLNGQEISKQDPRLQPPWYGCDLWTRQGVAFLDEARATGKPFFLYLAHAAPHFPCMAPEATIAKYRGKYLKGWDQLREERHQRQIALGLVDPEWPLTPRPSEIPAWDSLSADQQRRYDDMMAIYAAMIDEIDQSVGRLVAALKERKVLDDTLILFLSDNGGNAESGIAGKYEGTHPGGPDSNVFIGQCWAHLSNTPFRKYKHYNHEGGIATPLIAHWPARIANATPEIDWQRNPAHLIDLMPTVADAAQAEYPTKHAGKAILPMEGQSLLPLMTEKNIQPERTLYWEHEGNAAIRVGDWKLVRQGRTGAWELHNLQQDRTEQRDLAAQMPEKTAALSTQWKVWAQRVHALPYPESKKRGKGKKGKAKSAKN